MKVHKVYQDEANRWRAECGHKVVLRFFDTPKNVAVRWRGTTCKRCLAKRRARK